MNIPLKLLLLEDDPFDAELNITMLEAEGYACEWERVQTKKEFLGALKTPNYDIILIDYNLPAFDGMTALHLLKEQKLDIPVLFVTGNLQAELAIDSIKAGATDFVHKDRLTRLGSSVARAIEEFSLRRLSQEKENTLALFREINQFANEGATLDELADFLAEQIPPILSCASAAVHLRDKENSELLVYIPKDELNKYKKIEEFLGVSIPQIKLSLDTDSIYASLISDKKERILTEKKDLTKLLKDYLNAAPFPPKVKKNLAPLLPALIPIIGREKVHLIPIISGEHAIGLLELSYDKKADQSNATKTEEVLQQVSTIFSRKLSEVELAQLHRQQKLILDSAAEGILGMDMEGKHIFVNPAARCWGTK
ncbi:MAG: response regulator [Anaerolineae bacterium]|jgi:FixJ family two-component response regulator|nr:response regulator [Anaerolineae bacterium]MBT7990465.1 response regulator [Anaerolineae bacterium]